VNPVRIGIVTDSSSQITADLVDRFDVEVVPMTVTIDEIDHLEGIDLDADGFYGAFAAGARPEITTAQPSPGRFADAYARMADRGYDHVVSIHVSSSMSGTVGSAELAARSAPVPVTVIDSGSASFGIAICVWAAGVALARGADADDVRRRVDGLVPSIVTAFMIGVPHLAERSGRVADVDLDDGIQVLARWRSVRRTNPAERWRNGSNEQWSESPASTQWCTTGSVRASAPTPAPARSGCSCSRRSGSRRPHDTAAGLRSDLAIMETREPYPVSR